MFSTTLKCGTVVSLLAVLMALYLRKDLYYSTNDGLSHAGRQLSVLKGLLELETSNLVKTGLEKPRVAVGYGACKDLFVRATDLLWKYTLQGQPQHFNEIQNDEQFIKSFAYYFTHGAAAERYMSDSSLFDEWVEKASQIPNTRWELGGNAPVMASRFKKEGCDVLLAAKMTNELKSDLHTNIKVTSESEVTKDDIHLILEYATNEKWSGIITPRANRYIVHNDENNPMVSSLEQFDLLLSNFKPDLLVVSGLQMMDNYPFITGVREERLNNIKKQMIVQGKHSRVHFEMASFVEEQLLKDLMKLIIPYSDSIGMNEQELTNLHNLYIFGDVTHVVDSNPRVATVLDEMRKLYKVIRKQSEKIVSSKKLTRIHVHTLAYQAILTETNSNWRRSKAAAAKASLTATRHVCANNNIDIMKSKLILDNSFAVSAASGSHRINVTDDQPVSCWDEQIYIGNGDKSKINICIAPVLVCTEAKQTAGCGDNISSAGLVLQI